MTVEFDVDEDVAMTHLLSYMKIVRQDWKMLANDAELVGAIHVLQGFIVQHMLHRLNPDLFASWVLEPD